MARKQKEPSEKVTVRVPVSLREDLQTLAEADKRDEESDYWRKVLSDHVDAARKAGKLPPQRPHGPSLDVQVVTPLEG